MGFAWQWRIDPILGGVYFEDVPNRGVTAVDSQEQSDKACARRLRTALDLADSGILLRRQQLRRAHPDASEAEITERLNAWLRKRRGARVGDVSDRHRRADQW